MCGSYVAAEAVTHKHSGVVTQAKTCAPGRKLVAVRSCHSSDGLVGNLTQLNLRTSARTASRASCAAWNVAGGNPPSASDICSGVIARASEGVFPRSNSVRRDEQAIAV